MTDLAQAAVPASAGSATEDEQSVVQDLVDQDLLVEEVSIDGMCGVY
ncbi:mycofactocin precursor MftA [Streptomyces sp. NPDC002623]